MQVDLSLVFPQAAMARPSAWQQRESWTSVPADALLSDVALDSVQLALVSQIVATPQVLLTYAYVSIRQHTSAYVSIRQHTSAYVSIRQHTYVALDSVQLALVSQIVATPQVLLTYADVC